MSSRWRAPLYQRAQAQFVAISARQRELIDTPAPAAVIHHGLDPRRHHFGPGDGGYCAFLGRFSAEKGPHVAIDVARTARLPIRLAGLPHWNDGDYFDRHLADRLQLAEVFYVGEIGGLQKLDFLARARALLFPIDWEEPFGLVMIEALACGTPVVAYRRGSVPEVIDDGVTGFVVGDEDEAVRAIGRVGELSRRECRRVFEARYDAARMARDYVTVYRRLAAPGRGRERVRVAPPNGSLLGVS